CRRFALHAVEEYIDLLIEQHQQILRIAHSADVRYRRRNSDGLAHAIDLFADFGSRPKQAKSGRKAQRDSELPGRTSRKAAALVRVHEGFHVDAAGDGKPQEQVAHRYRFYAPQPEILECVAVLVVKKGGQDITARSQHLARLREVEAFCGAPEQRDLASLAQDEVADAVVVDVLQQFFVGEREDARQVGEVQLIHVELAQSLADLEPVNRERGFGREVIVAETRQEHIQPFVGVRDQVG